MDANSIPIIWLGYALGEYGLTDKLHAKNRNLYNTDKRSVQLLLSGEGLKS
jgi:hypothetical protein